MSIAFKRFGWTLLLTTPSAVELSVWILVGGCGCPISSSTILMYTHSFAAMYSAANLASLAEVITFLIIFRDGEDGTVVGWVGNVFREEDVRACPASRLRFTQIACVTVSR